MDGHMTSIEEIARAKAAQRRRRALLPITEKIRILVRLQQRRAPILASRGIRQRIWRIDDDRPASDEPEVPPSAADQTPSKD
jgi:hypothetical protein